MPSLDIEDAASLRRAYVDEGKSLATIADLAGCSYATVRRALLAQDIEIRRSGPPPIEGLRSREWLEARVREGCSAKDIAELLGCAESTVRSALHWAGMTSGPAPARPPALDDVAFLERAYLAEARSVRSIAQELGCTKDTVLAALRSAGVPIRRRGRAPRPVTAATAGAPEAPEAVAPDGDGEQEVGDPQEAATAAPEAGEPGAPPDPETDADVAPPEASAAVLSVEEARAAVVTALRPEDPPPAPPVPPVEAPAPEPEPEPEPEPPEADQASRGAAVRAAPESPVAKAILAPGPDRAPRAAPDPPMTASAPTQHENGAPVTPSTPPVSATEDRQPRSWAERGPMPPSTGNAPSGRVDEEIDKIEAKTFSVSLRGYDRQEVDAFLRSIAKDYRQVVRSAREAVNAARAAAAQASAPPSPPPPPPPPPAPSFEDVGGRVTAVLTSAAEAAEEIRAAAENEALAIRQEAREEAEHQRRAAAEALAELEAARAARDQELIEAEAAARHQAELIVTAAQQRAAQLEAEAQERATLTDRTVRANIDAVIAEARRDYEHLRSAQQQCIDRLASVEFLAKHARDGLSDNAGQSIDELL